MTRKKKNKKIFMTIFSIVIFILAFIIMINKNNKDNLGDIKDNSFNVIPVLNKTIVLEDMGSIYKRYFVIYLDNTDNTYIVHSFNYYNTLSQYELEYNRLNEKIVDYNINEYYIRYIYNKGIGNYEDILNNLENITNSRSLKKYD